MLVAKQAALRANSIGEVGELLGVDLVVVGGVTSSQGFDVRIEKAAQRLDHNLLRERSGAFGMKIVRSPQEDLEANLVAQFGLAL